jgi:hypothetical protein
MSDFKKYLKSRLAHYGLGRQYEASLVCDVAKKVSGGRFEPVSFKDGALKISVPNASRAHLVRLEQEEIILKVNKVLGREEVKRIRLEIRG